MTGASRLLTVLVTTIIAFLVQITVLPTFAWDGVVPGLVLLVVVGAALSTDAKFATLLGMGSGLLLDLAPPGDHTAGRWTLALLVVGYVVARVSQDDQPIRVGPLDAQQARQLRRPPLPLVLAAAAGGSFIGTSVFAFTGLIFGETSGVAAMLAVVGKAVVLDTVAGLMVIPITTWLFTRPANLPNRLVRDDVSRMSGRTA